MVERHEPIYSEREGEPELQETIERFVVRLAERIDALQDAEAENDFERLAALCDALRAEAVELGYPDLARAAKAVCGSCLEGKPEPTQVALVAMTELARRIRLAHRGAF